ncbi:DUF4105 domain-containing protein [Stutzerimonas balearica]|uniref:DUF4105 domain-containing protein n=1 Tax=Stutzerimonas balearica DSM 6083 TaxID=1123016 RepID=A0A8D4C8Q5_9GAMM|nr:DUF4105 domain-containing protein [Stutzerimonas balearica]AJE17207.1 hypothetical protein CL52_19935 [Stutzerimonas balearica DSM 6083]SDM85761.1 protein of unknown function [Stutzerimonas balearica DSM 6083]
MKRRCAWLLVSLLALASNATQAGLRLILDETDLRPTERSASTALLDEAASALPPRLVASLDRQVQVRWLDGLPSATYGRAGPDVLELNRRLLPSLADGSAAHQATARPHGTVRQELLATVIHEIAHLYDRARLWPADQALEQARCRQQAAGLGLVGLRDGCRGQTARRFTLSDDPRLLDLAGWPQQVGRRGAREQTNAQIARSPDRYELSNPREFVAVNLEYFLLDPSYACRRPSLHGYFRKHFGWQPVTAQPCETGYPILNAGRDFGRTPLLRLDPERVYQVDYLFAEANDAWVSRWGHSMLRLVICKPGRVPGPECRLDLDQHLVLSFRAFVDDVQLSSWDGLTGVYPSRLFVLPLDQVIEEYTKVELRGLASVPLKLTRKQIAQLVARSAELHWSYDGDYYFLSNNCAVETLKLLRSGTARSELVALDSILPNGLLELLIHRGLADASVLEDPREALRLGYRFDSYRDRYQAMFAVLRERLALTQQDVEQWLDLPARERSRWIDSADLRAAAAMLLVEQAALRRHLLLAQDELKNRYLSGRGQDASLERADSALKEILASSGYLSRPAELLDGNGYGLPQPSEWTRLERESEERQLRLNELSEELDREVRLLLGDERREELEAIEVNLAQIGERLRRLHKAGGGLELP